MYAYELPEKKILLSHVWNYYNRNVGIFFLREINCLRYREQLVKRDLQQLYSSSTIIRLTTSRTMRFNPKAHMTEMKVFKIQAFGDVTPCRLVNTD